MRRIGNVFAGAALLLWAVGFLTAVPSQAQNKGQTGQNQAQSGQGQSGQGQSGQVKGSFQGGIQQTPWFNNPDIRQQFKMNDDQFNRLNSAYQEAWNRYQKGTGQLDKTLTDDQRRQRMGELEQGFYKDFSAATNNIISDPQQRQRYNQLDLQYRGYGAFNDPTLTERLKLTPEQRAKFNEFGQDWSKRMNELGTTYQTDREGANKRFSKMQGEMGERINSVLTPEQQKTWRQMTGDPYNFSPNVYFQANAGTSGGKK